MGGIDPVPEKFTFKVKKYDYSDICPDDEGSDDDNKTSKRDEF
jgi:hypothetical protein